MSVEGLVVEETQFLAHNAGDETGPTHQPVAEAAHLTAQVLHSILGPVVCQDGDLQRSDT